MNGRDGKGLYGAVGTLFVAGILGGALYLQEPPYQSSRPSPAGPVLNAPLRGENVVPAYGWEDPLGPAHEHWQERREESSQEPYPGFEELGKLATERLNNGDLEHVLLVPVWNETTAIHEETRRRERYAIYAALTRPTEVDKGWVPEYKNTVAYSLVPFQRSCPGQMSLPVVHEWFERPAGDSSGKEYLLLLWIPEDVLKCGDSRVPLQRLAELAIRLLEAPASLDGGELKPDTPYSTQLAMIGPPDSSFMQTMVREGERREANSEDPDRKLNGNNGPMRAGLSDFGSTMSGMSSVIEKRELNNVIEQIHVISPRSTAPPHLLSDRITSPKKTDMAQRRGMEEPVVNEELENLLGVKKFTNVIARDDETVNVALEELERRGVNLSNIAVVTELDSSYASLFHSHISGFLEKSMGGAGDEAATLSKILEISLLRGIDGIVDIRGTGTETGSGDGPDRHESDQRSSGSISYQGLAGGLLDLPVLEYPAGNSQYDYLRRLAREFASGEIDRPEAIGIFGSDVYDKLLVLQAFRSSFPDAVFFTTDLDARLFDERDVEATRNLLVASAYGLQPEELPEDRAEIHRHPPIFRYSYQTATYHAVRKALDTGGPGKAYDPPAPRLFEIGRRGPMDITPVSHVNDDHDVGLRAGTLGFLTWGALALPLLISALIEMWRATNLPKPRKGGDDSRPVKASIAVVVLMVAALLVYTIFFIVWQLDPRLEPWVLFDGISTLPTFVLRAETVVVAIAIAWVGWARIQYSNKLLESRYFLSQSGGSSHSGSEGTGIGGGLFTGMRRSSISWWASEIAEREEKEMEASRGDECSPEFLDIWRRYQHLGAWWRRLLRALPLTIVLVGSTTWVVYVIYPEPHLVRGDVFRVLNNVMYVVALFVGYYAVFLSADAMKLLRQFIRALGYSKIDWSNTRTTGTNMDYLNSLRPVEIIESRTILLGTVLYWPFVIMLMLMVSRSRLFEGWIWSPWIVVLYIAITGYLVLHAALIQREAGKTREKIIHRLKRRDVKGDRGANPEVDRQAVEYLESLDEGVFTPWQRHPLFQALLLPFGGAGSLALLQLVL